MSNNAIPMLFVNILSIEKRPFVIWNMRDNCKFKMGYIQDVVDQYDI